ncbi:MAG: hypothetical protein KIT84_26005 [Labilithrix sp.]|nr:hypothetical protein [Labilithrix sp.]MCW5814509.1 hypothetical protein [Labilithrix sp.]
MKRSALLLSSLLVLVPAVVHCGGGEERGNADPDAGDVDGGPEPIVEEDKPLLPASKVDLLFVVDNSASMGDKQALLATAVSRVIRRLVTPSNEHKPVDLHLGVISSSLGNQGGDVCPEDSPRTNDRAHLLNKNAEGAVVAGAESGFLSFSGSGDVAVFEKAASDIIVGVGQSGCGLEAQLEAMYRFVAQPDPPETIRREPVEYVGVDKELLAQRKAFFRPDSAVAIVMLTDEDDSQVDPRANGGKGWHFTVRNVPLSKVARGTSAQGTTAARGTSACATDPASPDCASCAEAATCDASTLGCQKIKQDVNCTQSAAPGQSGPGYDGYYGPNDDDLNVRFHEMKRRYGVDPQYPIERYVKALSSRKVPNRDTEHDAAGNYVHARTCTNPLFAAALPAPDAPDLCDLPEGDRSFRLVFFQLIGGLPPALAGTSPDWTKILGRDPDAYDDTGIDPHMIPSVSPRPGLSGGNEARGDNGTDPVHGREWNTRNKDLQYACTLPLPEERQCLPYDACECNDDPTNPANSPNPPLCKSDGSTTQIRAKAYPTLRPLRVVKGLGDRALAASICSVDPTSGYGPLLETLASKMSGALAK